jgi:hypothetical protein
VDKEKTSRTEKESWIEERLFGLGDHYKTTISDGDKKVEEVADTAEEAERRAHEKWDEAYGDEDDD